MPITVIAELLGIPVEDQERFRELVELVRPSADDARSCRSSSPATPTSSSPTSTISSRGDVQNRPDDLVTALVQAEDAGDHLSENELYSMVVLLIVAGHETTVSLITNSVLALLSNPSQLAELRSDQSLLPSALEELLRYDSPVERTITRWAAVDVELGGESIRRGELVIAVVGSANRDASQFADPDSLDVRREGGKHVGFGRVHFCLGAALARLETEIALATLLERLPNLRLAIAEDDLYLVSDPDLPQPRFAAGGLGPQPTSSDSFAELTVSPGSGPPPIT